jgi:hypothetical protein
MHYIILLATSGLVKGKAFLQKAKEVTLYLEPERNNAKALADAVLEKTKEEIRKFDAEYALDEVDKERFAEILAGS